jgi:hypothetical protein
LYILVYSWGDYPRAGDMYIHDKISRQGRLKM